MQGTGAAADGAAPAEQQQQQRPGVQQHLLQLTSRISAAATSAAANQSLPHHQGDDHLVDSLEASLTMAQRALWVRRDVIATLLDEVAALKVENDLLAAAAVTDPSLAALRQRLHAVEAELSAERSARLGLERELADTAEVSWLMMMCVCVWVLGLGVVELSEIIAVC